MDRSGFATDEGVILTYILYEAGITGNEDSKDVYQMKKSRKTGL